MIEGPHKYNNRMCVCGCVPSVSIHHRQRPLIQINVPQRHWPSVCDCECVCVCVRVCVCVCMFAWSL